MVSIPEITEEIEDTIGLMESGQDELAKEKLLILKERIKLSKVITQY